MKVQTKQRWISLGLGLLGIVAVGSVDLRADSVGQPRPTVRISVYNDAGVKRGTLLRAEEDAAAVFRQGGIETEWKNCGDGLVAPDGRQCGEAAYPERLILRIERRPRGLVPEAFGVAYLSENGKGAYCDVFVEPMEELQRIHPVSLDTVLGHVAAHEIAHLLLGVHSHSANGLMRAHWDPRTIEEMKRGVLGFNLTQSAAMVERLEFARGTSGEGLVTMAAAAPSELSALPAQCPHSH
jgi:hypothetical protein